MATSLRLTEGANHVSKQLVESIGIARQIQSLAQCRRELNNKIMPTASQQCLAMGRLGTGHSPWKNVRARQRRRDERGHGLLLLRLPPRREERRAEVFSTVRRSASNPDEITILRAMVAARFSVFSIVDTTPGIGVTLHDTLRNEHVFVVDVSLSKTASVGGLLAGRLISPDGLTITTGAVQPVTAGAIDEIGEIIDGTFPDGATDLSKLSPAQRARFNVSVIRACLQNGSSAHVRYAEPGELGSPARRNSLPPGARGEGGVDLFLGGQPNKPGMFRSILGSLFPRRPSS